MNQEQVARTCAEIEDALEKCRRGELTKEEYETLKAELKKQLPIITFHATFKNGRRKNEDAVPSGMSIYDLDHIPNPRAKWAEIEARDEAQQMRHRQGVMSGTLGNMLATWKKRKYIEPYGEEMTGDQQGRQQYRKTETYLKKR